MLFFLEKASVHGNVIRLEFKKCYRIWYKNHFTHKDFISFNLLIKKQISKTINNESVSFHINQSFIFEDLILTILNENDCNDEKIISFNSISISPINSLVKLVNFLGTLNFTFSILLYLIGKFTPFIKKK